MTGAASGMWERQCRNLQQAGREATCRVDTETDLDRETWVAVRLDDNYRVAQLRNYFIDNASKCH